MWRGLAELGKTQQREQSMGVYKYIKQTFEEGGHQLLRQRLIGWRREPVILRIERPTKLHRARSIGYRAKQGILVVRVRVPRGGRMREQRKSGRVPKKQRRKKIVNLSYQTIAEARANDRFPNCEVLNSYLVTQDGLYYWFEVILVDKHHPAITADPQLSWIAEPQHQGRVYRGLTSSARKSRGLRRKGKGAEKVRPSLRANKRLLH